MGEYLLLQWLSTRRGLIVVNSHQNTYFSERQAEILRSFSLR